MAKVLINKEFLQNLGLSNLKEFIVEPNYILTPYAKDTLVENQIAIIYPDKQKSRKTGSCGDYAQQKNDDSVEAKIVKMLILEYNIPAKDITGIVKKVLSKMN